MIDVELLKSKLRDGEVNLTFTKKMVLLDT